MIGSAATAAPLAGRERLVASQARDAGLARELWERSTELAGLPGWP